MDDGYTPLNIFNDTFDSRYALNKTEILDFLHHVAANSQAFGVTDADVQQDLVVLEGKIVGLTDFDGAGSLYNDPTPAQQALRKKVSQASGKKPKLFPNPTDDIRWSVNHNKEKFFLLYDLLGAFLSPIAATTTELEPMDIAKQYFLPLVVLYAKWCKVLAAPATPPFLPTMVQVTWCEKDEKLYPFFGASLAGYDKGLTDFRMELRKERYNYLRNAGMLPDTDPHDYTKSYNDSPKRGFSSGDGGGGTRFGNCAETYPFLYALKGQVDPQTCYGISTNLAPLFGEDRFTVYNGRRCWVTPENEDACLVPPCDNCATLLKKCLAPAGNYTLWIPPA